MARRRRIPPTPNTRRPVRRLWLYNLASAQKWDTVYAMIDSGKACVDDFNDVRHPDDINRTAQPVQSYLAPCLHSPCHSVRDVSHFCGGGVADGSVLLCHRH